MALTVVPIKTKGFTLIEILLVLALIVVLTMSGIAAYQIQLRNYKVDKTALQMQQWLQAGLAYYTDCNQWPRVSTDNDMLKEMMGINDLTSCSSDYNGKKRTYMSQGSQVGVINNGYQFGPAGGASPPNPQTDPQFYVSTQLGTNKNNADEMLAIGKMIAGRLPNAKAEPSPGYVTITATVPRPGASSGGGGGGGGNNGFIVDMEMVSSTKTAKHIKQPDASVCGSGLVPVLVSAISGVDAGRAQEPNKGQMYGVMRSSLDQVKLDNNGFISDISVDQTTKLIKPLLATEREKVAPSGQFKNDGKNQVLLISACLPDPNKKNLHSKVQTSLSPELRY